MACGPGSPELSRSYPDMADNIILTFIFTCTRGQLMFAMVCRGCVFVLLMFWCRSSTVVYCDHHRSLM